MSKDAHLAAGEEEFKDARARVISTYAGRLVVQGDYSRQDAWMKAEAIFEAQREASDDVTGVKATLAEAQSPQVPEGKEAQAEAIGNDIYEKQKKKEEEE
ncbi:hypothetical protein H3H36_08415 [Duganella sp. FT3S]|uniref:Uncharacterized protein n=1 Tax=Rugamonas fusca TaxID=2758568 RepID=A0A7W2EGJ4_9BURK|nr:hypothetical protein [Rugamonas fusca]MBA5605382.1 hypothetical protein [Rugamonas fusca]